MGMWKSGLDRAKTGETNQTLVEELQPNNVPDEIRNTRVEEFLAKQPNKVPYEIRNKDDKEWVVDFDGSIEIRDSDLENGNLLFKIGRLTGDLICYCRHIKPSLIPEELGGEIIFKHHLLGDRTKKTRFKINDKVWFLSKNEPTNKKVKQIIITSSYTDDLTIADNIQYVFGIQYVAGDYVEETVNESETFASAEELKERLSNPHGSCCHQPDRLIKTTSYAVGDEVWFMKDNQPMRKTIQGVEIIVKNITDSDGSEVVHTDEKFIVKEGDESLVLTPAQIYDTRSALVDGLR